MTKDINCKRSWYCLSLRTMWLSVTILAMLLGCVGMRHRSKLREREAVKAISSQDVKPLILYDYQWNGKLKERIEPSPSAPGPSWIRRMLGDDYLARVHLVYFDYSWEGYPESNLIALRAMSGLRVLSLRRTEFSNNALKQIENLTQVESLDLSHSQYSDSSLASLERATQLKELELSVAPRLTGRGLCYLKQMKNLEGLYLGGDRVGNDGLVHLSGLDQLRRLRLCGTEITDDGLASLEGLRQLEFLDISRTNVTDLGLAHLERLRTLKELYVDGTKVTDAGLAHLKGLTRLKTLYLTGNVTGSGLVHLGGLKQLELLSIPGVSSNSAALVHLKGLTRLQKLDVDLLTSDDRRQIQIFLPSLIEIH